MLCRSGEPETTAKLDALKDRLAEQFFGAEALYDRLLSQA